MLRKFTLALFIAALAIGCSKPAANSNSGNSNVKKADGKIDVGDKVIVLSNVSESMYFMAEVETVEGQSARVVMLEDLGGGNYRMSLQRENVEMADIYEVPDKGSKTDVKIGDTVLAKGMPGGKLVPWYGAEVVDINELGVRVKGLGENKQPWMPASDEIIKPSEKTLAALKQSGASSMLLADAKKHKLARVEGYTPKVGDKVLAEAFVGSWYSGTVSVVEIGMSGAISSMRMKYDDPNNRLVDRVYTVVPLPTAAKSVTPTEGQYLLVKPTSGDRWLYAQVIKVDGQSAEVKVEDGSTRVVAPGEFLPLE